MNLYKKFKLASISSLALSGLVLSACGPKLDSSGASGDQMRDNQFDRSGEMITISVGIAESFGFNLANLADFNMTLEGCASGWSVESITSVNPYVDLYKHDLNCVIKLVSFSLNGKNYVIQQDFTDWMESDTAVFVNDKNANEKLTVRVNSQLSSPVTEGDSVAYSFTESGKGQSETAGKGKIAQGVDLAVAGISAPGFEISDLEFVGMTADGAGRFKFRMECDSVIAGDSCEGNSLSDITYVLLANSNDAGSFTYDEIADLYNSAPANSVADNEHVAANASFNGGFDTKVLNGPNQMHKNPKMVLILSASDDDYSSYRYYLIDIETLSY